MACVAPRRGKWVLDYYDHTRKRRWVTYDNEEDAEKALLDVHSRKLVLKRALACPPVRSPPAPMLKISDCSGIYFLWRNGKVVYVGQSEHIFSRIKPHIERGKLFDEFSWIIVRDRRQRTVREAAFIKNLKPEYNAILNPHNPRVSRFPAISSEPARP